MERNVSKYMEKLVWFKCSNCGCLMFLKIHDLTKYCDGG